MSITDKLKRQMQDEHIKMLERLSEEMVKLDEPVDENYIYESEFKKYFLPLIKGDIPVNEENMKRFYHNLVSVCKNPYTELKVVDQNKNTLFVLPPLMLHISEDSLLFKQFNFYGLIRDYHGSNELPAVKERRLKDVANGLIKYIKPDSEEERYYLENLRKMYEYYGIVKREDPIDNEDETKQDEDISDIFDYD